MARVVVFGANGFIGSALSRSLASSGHEVTGFDRFRSESSASSSVRRFVGDFARMEDVERALRGQDVAVHLVGSSTPATAELDLVSDIRASLESSVSMFHACVNAQVPRLIFASSGGAVYGPQGRDSYRESDPTMPISPYGILKLATEHYLDYFETAFGLKSTIARISNPYGPGQRGNRAQGLVGIALARIVAGEAVTQLGDGEMVRDYLYIDDLAAVLTAMVTREPAHRVYNVGSGVGSTVREVFAALRLAWGHDFPVTVAEKPRTFVDKVVLDVTRLREEFSPPEPIALSEGVARTVREWRERELG